MATQTDAEKKAAEAAKLKEVPEEVRRRLLRGEPAPKEDPEAKAKAAQVEADAKAKKDKEDADTAKAKADAEEAKKKKKKPDLPPIPAQAVAPVVTEDKVREIVAGAKAEPVVVDQTKLAPEDQNDLQQAEFAARQYPDRYGELPKKLVAFIGQRDQFLADKAKELGGRESPDFRDFVRGEDYQRFVRENCPGYQRGDRTKIYEEYLEDRGAQRALRTIQPKLDEVSLRQKQIEQQPIIDRTVVEGVKVMITDDAQQPDEALSEFAKNPMDFVKANEVEGGIIVRQANFFKEAMEETLRITSGLVDVSKMKNPTPTQQWIDQFIVKKETELETKFPNGAALPDGKIIVSQGQMDRLRAARVPNLAAYRTMTGPEVVGAIAIEGRLEIKRQLEAERGRLQRSGFARVKAEPPAANGAKPPTITPPASPMAGAAAARGAADGRPPAEQVPYWQKYVTGKA